MKMRERIWKKILFGLVMLLIPVAGTYKMSGAYGIAEPEVRTEDAYILRGQQRIPLEEYLTGAVAYYMPLECEDETYKVMSVILRTHIMKKIGAGKEIEEEKLELQCYGLEEMQVRFGEQFAHSYSRYQTAVQATAGELIRYKGELIEPYFHQVSAGMTNCVEDRPYLVSVESRQDMQARNYLFLKTVSAEEFVSKLEQAGADTAMLYQEGVSAGRVLSEITWVMRTDEYVDSILWKEKRIPASRLQELFSLPSPAFRLEVYEENIRILAKGIGHGVGLSLYGADAMAKEGESYREILTYYYSNITVSDE